MAILEYLDGQEGDEIEAKKVIPSGSHDDLHTSMPRQSSCNVSNTTATEFSTATCQVFDLSSHDETEGKSCRLIFVIMHGIASSSWLITWFCSS